MGDQGAARSCCDLLDAMPRVEAGMIGIGADGRIFVANQRLEQMFGYGVGELLGQSPELLVQAPRPLWTQVRGAPPGGPGDSVEGIGLRKDGGQFPVLVSAANREGPDRETWVATVFHDLTREKHSAQIEARLAAVLRSAYDAIIGTTLDGTVTDWNPGAVRLYGYTEEEMVGRPLHVVFPGGNWSEEHELFRQLASGSVERYQADRLHRNGTIFRVSVIASPLVDGNGDIVGATFLAREAKPLSRLEFNVLEAFPDAVFGVDGSGVIALMNGTAEAMFEYSRSELIGQPVEILVPEVTRRMHMAHRQHYMTHGHDQPRDRYMTVKGRRKSGAVFPAEITLKPVETQDGVLVLSVIRDQSEARRARAEQNRLQAENERARMEIGNQQARRMESLGELAGGIAHEFNNLLAVIINSTEFLADVLSRRAILDESDRASVNGDIQRLQRAGRRATDLTRQLLTFGRRDTAAPEVLDLNEVVKNTVSLLERTLGEHIEIQTYLHQGLAAVRADPGQLEQVLLNLAINSRDAMPRGGTLSIDTAVAGQADLRGIDRSIPGDYVRLRVSDTGVGMSAEVTQRAFEPFFTTKPTGASTGLGLSAVHGIVTKADGHISIYSQPGVGTTICVLLPVARAPLPTPEEPAPAAQHAGGHETILIAEDDPDVLAVTARVLASRGYQVITADDGDRALELAREFQGAIHLLVTDVLMPGMHGPELAERITSEYRGIPVLYISGYPRPEISSGVLEGDALLLKKPFTPGALLEKVRQALNTRSRTAPP